MGIILGLVITFIVGGASYNAGKHTCAADTDKCKVEVQEDIDHNTAAPENDGINYKK